MIAIHPLPTFDRTRFIAIAGGYTTTERYRVARHERDGEIAFTLTLEPLGAPTPFTFPFGEEELARYNALPAEGYCLGAFDGPTWVGAALGEPHHWNNTLWVWEFHVAEAYRGQGIGRQLMDALAGRAAAAGFRALVVETQNTNVPAIRFYRAAGFTLDGIDLSYYTNDDTRPGRTVALFMKRRLEIGD